MAGDRPSGRVNRNTAAAARRAALDYDFVLMIATIAVAVLIGALFVTATVYSFFAAQADPLWTDTSLYSIYIASMNSYLFPLLVTLIVLLGLCIPRRILRRGVLVGWSAVLLVVTLGLMTGVSRVAGWAFLILSATGIQLVVIVLTAKRSPQITYLQEGFLMRMGSAVLHLGLIVLVAAFVVGLNTSAQLAVFWTATALIGAGMISSLYSEELGTLGRRLRRDAACAAPENRD